ncbi:MAG: MFS transporter, partial [Lachnospiraceae bacterium]|nr:MFS transporter [Lachnospiraceae bacterium]
YFGIYDIFAKGASFLGSAVIAAVKLAGGTINIAVASLAIFFALGFLFLKLSDKQPLRRGTGSVQ